MIRKHRTRRFRSRLLAVTLLLGASPSWAEPTIPQDVLDAIAQDGSARVVVGLDVPWQPEGLLNANEVTAQRKAITYTQSQFVSTLSQNLADDEIIDSPHSPDGTPTVTAARTLVTVPYLVMEVNSVTLPYVQNTPKANTMQLSVADEPSMSDSLPLIGADKAWDSGNTGLGQAIAIIDTGVDNAHPAFAPARIITEACFSATHCPNGKAQQTGEVGAAMPCDFDSERCGHGTHVAGIAAGTAPDAKLIAVQAAFNSFGKAKFYLDDQLAALDWLHANRDTFGVPLAAINLSVGGKKPHSSACDADARTKIIRSLESVGIATIVSSGNQGHADGIGAPACISEAISVGATDKAGQIWSQTNRAGILDLLAPGVGIESALPGGLTGAKDGTSMAAPHVAGAWAIMKAANPEASVAEILGKLKDTGKDVDGRRRIQVDAALPPPVQPAQGLNEGLVAYYPFDGNANDASGNGNDGVITGNVVYVQGRNDLDQAVYFNNPYGSVTANQYMSLPYSQSIQNMESSSFTISIFYKTTDNFQYNGRLFGNAPYFVMDYNAGNKAQAYSHVSDGSNNYYVAKSADNNPNAITTDGQFHWQSLVLDRENNSLSQYIDGNLIDVTDISAIESINLNGLVLGASRVPDTYGARLTAVDELRLYNRALSESEIKQLAGIDPGCDVVSNGLVACYPFDGNANDGSGNGTQINLDATIYYADGVIGQGLASTENDNNVGGQISVSNPFEQEYFTISYWSNAVINHNKTYGDSGVHVWYNRTDSSKQSFGFTHSSGNHSYYHQHEYPQLIVSDNTNNTGEGTSLYYGDNQLNEREWQHILLTYKNGNIDVFVNGLPIIQNKLTSVSPVGRDMNISLRSNDMLDDLRIYNRALSETEVKQLASIKKEPIIDSSCNEVSDGLVACYPFDGNANDESGNGNHGAENGTIEYVEGKVGQAVKLNGNLSYLRVPNPEQKFDKQHTITGWVSTKGRGMPIFSKYSWNGGTGRGFNIVTTTENGNTNVTNGSTLFQTIMYNEGPNISKSTKYTLPINKFKYVSATYNEGHMKLYIDGVLVDESIIQHAGTLDNPYDMSIGTYWHNFGKNLASSRTFDGIIDDLRVYNRALTESEIQTLYELGSDNVTLTVTKTGGGEITTTDNTINCGEICQADYEVDSTVTLTATPATGFSFSSWSGDCTGTSATTTVTMDAAKSCTATFVVQPSGDSLNVTKTGNGRGTIRAKIKGETDWTIHCKSDCQQASYDYASNSEVFIKAYPEKGFTFNGWTGDCTGTDNRVYLTIDTAKTCTAQFEPEATSNLLTVNPDGTGNGTITTTDGYINCGSDCSEFYRADKKVRLEATPATADNLFMGWSGACSGLKNSVRITMDAAKSCTATFKAHNPADMLTFTVNNDGDGLGTISVRAKGEKTSLSCRGKQGCKQATHEYASGTQVTLYATPNTGFEFTDGSGDCPWESYTDKKGRLRASATVIMDQAKNCTANFGLKSDLTWHKLTIYTAGTGNGSVNNVGHLDCGNNCSADYHQAGTEVRLRATPSLLAKFVSWNGDCTGTKGTIKVTLTADMTCTAVFQSIFELIAADMVEAFYTSATLDDGTPVAERYPRTATNEARLQEAFWLTMPAIIQVDQHLAISTNQTWPAQFDATEWLPTDAAAQHAQSVQIINNQFVGIGVELIAEDGTAEEIGIVTYYSDEPPVIENGNWGGRYPYVAYYSRYAFRW